MFYNVLHFSSLIGQWNIQIISNFKSFAASLAKEWKGQEFYLEQFGSWSFNPEERKMDLKDFRCCQQATKLNLTSTRMNPWNRFQFQVT